MTFADLGLSDELLRAVSDSGYDEPTPIQRAAIPSVLMGKDLIGIAQTGTGKTAGFVLPMIDILHHGRSRARMPRSLILEPTRELAQQVSENFEKYGKYHPLSMALLIGGVQMGDQVKALEKGVDVLIATPGRLMDLFHRGKILLNGCELLVIDEADRMLDMGFIPDIEEICSKLPKIRQTLLFSATMPPPIQKLAAKFLNDPKRVEVARPATANVNIEQRLVEVRADKKKDALARHPPSRGIQERDRLLPTARRRSASLPRASSARASRSARSRATWTSPTASPSSTASRRTRSTILVASDVAARGLDVKGVSHVINFDVPWQPDDYIHRIGRTGRAGMTGIAITLATREDAEAVSRIEKLIGHKIAAGRRLGRSEGRDPTGKPAASEAEAGHASRKAEKPPRPKTQRRPRERARSTSPKPKRRPSARPSSRTWRATGTARCPASSRSAPAIGTSLTLESLRAGS